MGSLQEPWGQSPFSPQTARVEKSPFHIATKQLVMIDENEMPTSMVQLLSNPNSVKTLCVVVEQSGLMIHTITCVGDQWDKNPTEPLTTALWLSFIKWCITTC